MKTGNWGLLSELKESSAAVYVLIENGEYVYVGSTCCPDKRFASHCMSERFLGRELSMEILDWVPESERFSVERLAIRLGFMYGYPLENRVWRRREVRGGW